MSIIREKDIENINWDKVNETAHLTKSYKNRFG
jgi:hypothetical protein